MNFIALLVTVVSAFLITSVIGMWLIPFLRRLHFGQTILDIGPAWHKSKQGTPTMGGIMFIAGITIAILAGWLTLELSEQGVADASAAGSFYLWGGLLMALAFGLIGFLDDYISVVKKQNLGLKAGQKSLAQLLVAVVYLAAQQIFAPTTSFWLPFIGDLDIGIFDYPLMLFIIVGTVNAVNLTDGIDGLGRLGDDGGRDGLYGDRLYRRLLPDESAGCGASWRLSGIPGVEFSPGKGVHGGHRVPVFGRHGGRAGLWPAPSGAAGIHRHCVCGGDPLGYHPDRQRQADRQACL